MTGSGLEGISCLENVLTVDRRDCVHDVQISFSQYCSNQDEIHATMVKPFVRGRTVPSSDAGSKLSETASLKLNTLASEPGSSDFRALVIADMGYAERTFAVESRRRMISRRPMKTARRRLGSWRVDLSCSLTRSFDFVSASACTRKLNV